MADTTFIDYQTPVVASWLNEVNDHVHSDTPATGRTVAHNADSLGYVPTAPLVSTNVQDALDEIAPQLGVVVDNSISTNKLQDDAVTFAKMQNINENVLLGGNDTGGGAGNVKEISIGSNLSLSSGVLSAIVPTATTILENPIINGGFEINQRAAASIADDVYGHDRWYALTQTGAIAPSTITNAENGTPYMARLTQSQVSAQRFGYAQIIESVNCIHLRGQQVTFKFDRVRLSASSNLRYAVLEWTGTADTVTSDVVNDWTSSTYTAGNFFLASNLTVSGVVQQAVTANTLTNGSSVTVTLGSSFNNLIVFVWTESTQAQNVTLDLSKAQIDLGTTAQAFRHLPYSYEFTRCARYYFRLTSSAVNDPYAIGGLSSTTASQYYFPFPTQMRIAPTGVETSTASNFNVATSAALTVSAITSIPMTRFVGGVAVTHSAGTAGDAGRLRGGSGDFIGFTGAEL